MSIKKHSKFSASGAERWLNCPGSVALSEGLPDKDSEASLWGTLAHECLEHLLLFAIRNNVNVVSEFSFMAVRRTVEVTPDMKKFNIRIDNAMEAHCIRSANFILNLHHKIKDSEIMVETKIGLSFIHPDMFGTFDGAVLDHFKTLHIFDFKYGTGHAVSPAKNLQMIFYALGLAHLHHWNFQKVRLWIDQPRIRGYDGPSFWETSMEEIRSYEKIFKDGVDRVINEPDTFKENGNWCYFCKAKKICPLKNKSRAGHARMIFGEWPVKKGG